MSRMSELDMERSNVLNFVTDGRLDRILARRERREEGLRENFKRDVEHAISHADQAMDHCRDMQRAGFDIGPEMDAVIDWAAAFLLAVQTAKLTSKRLQAAE